MPDQAQVLSIMPDGRLALQDLGSLLDAASLPKRHRKRQRHELHGDSWWTVCASLKERLCEPGVFVITGLAGCGKTQFAVEWLREACGLGVSCRYATAADLVHGLRAGGFTESARSLFVQPSVLVVDDFEQAEAADRVVLDQVLYARTVSGQQTFVMASLAENDPEAVVGEYVINLALERGLIFACDWGPIRHGRLELEALL